MRVLHVVPTYAPAWRYGGPIRSVHGLARAQAAAGDRVEVFTTDVDGPERLPVAQGVGTLREGVIVTYFSTRSPRRLYRSPALQAAARRRIREFDVVHLHSVFLWPTSAVAREAVSAAVPYVVSPRGMLVSDLISTRGALRKRLWIRLVERRTLRESEWIVVTSDYEAEEIRRLRLDLAPVEVIPNGVALDYGEESAGWSDALAEFTARGPFLLFLGRLAWKKRLEKLIEAVSTSVDIRLVIAGGDEDGLATGLASIASLRGVEGRVHFAGEVRGEAKERLLRGARCLVLPSSSENFGNVVLEAMAAGRPALVSAGVGVAPDLIAHGAGWVFGEEANALAEALEQVWRDAAGCDRAGEAGRRWVEAELGWDRIAGRMAATYRAAIQAQEARSR